MEGRARPEASSLITHKGRGNLARYRESNMSSKKEVKRKVPAIDHLAERKSRNLSQSQYWNPLGVTQSSGSRYEAGNEIPLPVQKLAVVAYSMNIIIPEII